MNRFTGTNHQLRYAICQHLASHRVRLPSRHLLEAALERIPELDARTPGTLDELPHVYRRDGRWYCTGPAEPNLGILLAVGAPAPWGAWRQYLSRAFHAVDAPMGAGS